MHRSLKPFLVALVCLILSSKAQAQMRYIVVDPYWSRFDEIGIIGSFAAPTIEAFHYVLDQNGNGQEKKVWGKTGGFFSYGGSIGSGVHLAKLGNNNSLALNLTFLATYAKINVTDKMVPIEKGFAFSEEVEMLRGFVPLGIDYKVGAEAMSDKTLKKTFTIGGGIALHVELNSEAAGFLPFIKAEAGYHFGIAMKLRAMYFPGEQQLYASDFKSDVTSKKVQTPISYERPHFQISSGGSVQLALIIMPFSYTWQDY